ncbi:kinase-like domain-containing protein [Pelagophyceae sp. CCMP2097]|nr:kinase-like domain-containing protein [Pelagophyceae sp. CCMP2097]
MGRRADLAAFLVDRVRIERAVAETYAKQLVADGFDDINSLRDDLREENVRFFEKGHARRLLAHLANSRGAAAPTSRAREPDAEVDESDESERDESDSSIEDTVGLAQRAVEDRWRGERATPRQHVVSPLAYAVEEEPPEELRSSPESKKSPVAAARWRANGNVHVGRVVPQRALSPNAEASSPRGVTQRGRRHLRVHELIWQRRRRASTGVDDAADAPRAAERWPRPESAPLGLAAAPDSPLALRRSVSHQQQRRRGPAVSGIVLRTELPPESSASTRSRAASQETEYELSEAGVLKLGEFEIGPEGAKQFDSPSLRCELVALDELGRGAGGCVQRALHAPSGIVVAVKRMCIDDDGRRRQMVLELRALHGLKGPTALAARIQHGLFQTVPAGPGAPPRPNAATGTGCRFVIDFLDTFVDPASNSLCLVLELMNGGSLENVKRATKRTGACVDERLLARVAFCVLSALAFIHGRRELHRDIKPSNILLNLRGECKVSDYGCHRALDDDTSLASSFVGTLAYMAPERVAGGGSYSYASDVWSLGLSLLSTALGENPFAGNAKSGYFDILHAVQSSPAPKLDADKFSADFQHFIYRCLRKDPAERPGAADLLQCAFVRGGRRAALGPIVQRALPQQLDRGLPAMLSALEEARDAGLLRGRENVVGESLSPQLLSKVAAQLGVELEDMHRVYADVRAAAAAARRAKKPSARHGGDDADKVDALGATMGKLQRAHLDGALRMPAAAPPRRPRDAAAPSSKVSPRCHASLLKSYESHASSNLGASADLNATLESACSNKSDVRDSASSRES